MLKIPVKHLVHVGTSAVIMFSLCCSVVLAAQQEAMDQLTAVSATDSALPVRHAMGHALHSLENGEVSLDDCLKAGGLSVDVSAAQQEIINKVVGDRAHRIQHALWHAMRSGLTDKETGEVAFAFGASWTQDHAFCPPPGSDSSASDYNPAGEDFLYMHRGMVGAVRAALIRAGLKCISGWPSVPDPEEWPLPDDDRSGPKSPETLSQLKIWDAKLHDPAWLASVSLSQLGMAVELTTHNNLHMRYATSQPPKGFDGVDQTGGAPLPLDGKFPAKWAYDNPAYNWLADPYGAALNPLFWKIHGYVDSLIDLWLRAHNFKRIAEDCAGDPECYQWHGTWTGTVPESEKPSISRDQTATQAHGGGGAEISSAPIDAPTRRFNQDRMRRQQLGVLRGPAAGTSDHTTRSGSAVPSPDPFRYAVQQACGTQAR